MATKEDHDASGVDEGYLFYVEISSYLCRIKKICGACNISVATYDYSRQRPRDWVDNNE